VQGGLIGSVEMRLPSVASPGLAMLSRIADLMKLAGRRFVLLGACAFLLAACQSDDEPPLPRYVSNSYNAGGSTVAPASYGVVQNGQAANARVAAQGGYFIEFRSRYALSYGHSYVVFGRADANGAMINPEVAGLAPASDSVTPYVLGHFVPVPAETGWSDGDLEEEYRSASWRVMLSEADYRRVVADIRKLQASSKSWSATVYNCNAFVASIANSMGFKAPGIWLRPQQFITRLREMNGG
jgi:hypothetical protein